MDYVWIGVGAAAGANARYLLGQLLARWFGTDFPVGTLVINVSGSLLIGLILATMSDGLMVDTHWRLLLVIGLLGGYTTFSSFSFEVIAMVEAGRWLPAVTYVGSSVLFSLFGCYAGMLVARLVEG
jgi:CrcB protein